MSEQQGFQFRTATFGGFQKQDVMNYLEMSAKEHARQMAELRRELQDLRQSLSETAEKTAAAEQIHKELEEAKARLEAENQKLAATLSQREETLSALEAKKAEAEALVSELRLQVEKLSPAASAYEAVKDRAAALELEAFSRAQQIEEDARRKAEELRQETVEWFSAMKEGYGKLHIDVDAIVGRIAKELEQAGAGLDQLSGAVHGYDASMGALQRKIESLGGEAGQVEPKLELEEVAPAEPDGKAPAASWADLAQVTLTPTPKAEPTAVDAAAPKAASLEEEPPLPVFEVKTPSFDPTAFSFDPSLFSFDDPTPPKKPETPADGAEAGQR